MGLKLGIDKYCWHPGSFVPLQEEHLAYHAEWGWIMQVIEKIESFHLYVHIETHGCNINSRGCEDEKYPWLEKFWNVEIDEIIQEDESKIIATWKCCVKFIKWYNENK